MINCGWLCRGWRPTKQWTLELIAVLLPSPTSLIAKSTLNGFLFYSVCLRVRKRDKWAVCVCEYQSVKFCRFPLLKGASHLKRNELVTWLINKPTENTFENYLEVVVVTFHTSAPRTWFTCFNTNYHRQYIKWWFYGMGFYELLHNLKTERGQTEMRFETISVAYVTDFVDQVKSLNWKLRVAALWLKSAEMLPRGRKPVLMILFFF